MSASVIAIVNQKGGAGKTTVAMQLAGTLALRNKRVLVVDTDPQGSASRWAASAPEEAPFPAQVVSVDQDSPQLKRRLATLAEDQDFLILDTPPHAGSKMTLAMLESAHLALVPVNPSPLDLWASLAIVPALEKAAAANPGLTARLVVNQAQMHVALTREIVEILSGFAIPVLRARLGQRTAYRQSAAYGQTVHALGARAATAIEEVEALAEGVLGVLRRARAKAAG